MALISTRRKEKLPKGFSYPLGAGKVSAALEGIPQFENAEIWFSWRDEFWASQWRKRIQERGVVTLLRASYWDYSGRWDFHLYSVPSEYNVFAREHLLGELPRVYRELSGLAGEKRLAVVVTLNLSEAERAGKNSKTNLSKTV